MTTCREGARHAFSVRTSAFEEPARKLVDSHALRDVKIVVVTRKNVVAPTQEELKLLQQYQGAEAVACQINRKYRKTIAPFVDLKYTPKKFRVDDQQLMAWLIPVDQGATTYEKPRTAFLQAAQHTSRLVLHPDALKRADELPEHRWAFAGLGAALLARYANGEIQGAIRRWEADHGIKFAVNGRVRFKYRVTCGTEHHVSKTEWHLKEGDNTTRESAARVYFDRVEFSTGVWVVVFYVGPHPPDGEYDVALTIDVP
jgi:hypothetical protein